MNKENIWAVAEKSPKHSRIVLIHLKDGLWYNVVDQYFCDIAEVNSLMQDTDRYGAISYHKKPTWSFTYHCEEGKEFTARISSNQLIVDSPGARHILGGSSELVPSMWMSFLRLEEFTDAPFGEVDQIQFDLWLLFWMKMEKALENNRDR